MIYNFTTDKEKISNMIDETQFWGEKIIFTNGCFDILHVGHIKYLSESKKLGGRLIVGLNSDLSVKLLKGKNRPINNQEDRSLVLDNIKSVDDIIIFDEYSVLDLIMFIKPNIITKGGDYTPEQLAKDGGDFMKKTGGELVIFPFYNDISTTKIINKLK